MSKIQNGFLWIAFETKLVTRDEDENGFEIKQKISPPRVNGVPYLHYWKAKYSIFT